MEHLHSPHIKAFLPTHHRSGDRVKIISKPLSTCTEAAQYASREKSDYAPLPFLWYFSHAKSFVFAYLCEHKKPQNSFSL